MGDGAEVTHILHSLLLCHPLAVDDHEELGFYLKMDRKPLKDFDRGEI